MRRMFPVVLILFVMLSCGTKEPEKKQTMNRVRTLAAQFNRYKAEKDSSFLYASWSPLLKKDKVDFTGLHYFPYNPSWRYEGPVHIYEKPDTMVIMGTRHGKGRQDLRPALKYGYFAFERDGKEYRLEIIKILPAKPGGKAHLFLGFWDATSGKETYAGGRYIDMEKIGPNRYIVDFNYAYNPYCAYNHKYSCAIPPLENRLPIAVNAGEKIYKKEH